MYTRATRSNSTSRNKRPDKFTPIRGEQSPLFLCAPILPTKSVWGYFVREEGRPGRCGVPRLSPDYRGAISCGNCAKPESAVEHNLRMIRNQGAGNDQRDYHNCEFHTTLCGKLPSVQFTPFRKEHNGTNVPSAKVPWAQGECALSIMRCWLWDGDNRTRRGTSLRRTRTSTTLRKAERTSLRKVVVRNVFVPKNLGGESLDGR